jgi:hypothetical protein
MVWLYCSHIPKGGRGSSTCPGDYYLLLQRGIGEAAACAAEKLPCVLYTVHLATWCTVYVHCDPCAGVRPYKCNLCEKSFTQRCSLESHCLKVHGVAHQYEYKQRRSKVFMIVALKNPNINRLCISDYRKQKSLLTLFISSWKPMQYHPVRVLFCIMFERTPIGLKCKDDLTFDSCTNLFSMHVISSTSSTVPLKYPQTWWWLKKTGGIFLSGFIGKEC